MIRLTFDRGRTKLQGTVVLPPSKSIAARALLLHALASGESAPARIRNLPDCDDTLEMRKALAVTPARGLVNIEGAGTAMRFLTAFFASQPHSDVVLTGNARMLQRPIGTLVDALRLLGADITYEDSEGVPPLHIRGKHLSGDSLEMDASRSSQYISAVMMIAPLLLPRRTENDPFRLTLRGKISSRPYIEMTRALMAHFGIAASWTNEDTTLLIPRGRYTDHPLAIEGDWSAASYWLAMRALAAKTDIPYEVQLQGLADPSIQGDSICAELLGPTFLNRDAISIDCSDCPDLIPTLTTTYFLLGTPFRIAGAENLRIKETDRIASLVSEAAKLGCVLKVENNHNNSLMEEALVWDGTRSKTHPTTKSTPISTFGDHRMAMAFAPAVLCLGQIEIEHPEVVEKSYPAFWNDLKAIGIGVEHVPEKKAHAEEKE